MPDIFVAPQPQKEEKKKAPPKEVVVEEKVEETIEGKPVQKPINPLAAFAVEPWGVRFENQEEEEKIIFLLRAHWVTNVPWLFLGFLLALAPLFLFPFLARFEILPTLPVAYKILGPAFWYLFTFGYLFLNFLIWYFNINLVTTERIIDVDFSNLIYKEVTATRIAKIQDVTYKVGGVIHQVFNYGDIFIQTAGTEVNIEFLKVPKPALVIQKIEELMEKEEKQWEKK